MTLRGGMPDAAPRRALRRSTDRTISAGFADYWRIPFPAATAAKANGGRARDWPSLSPIRHAFRRPGSSRRISGELSACGGGRLRRDTGLPGMAVLHSHLAARATTGICRTTSRPNAAILSRHA